jgi:hypothetical protein
MKNFTNINRNKYFNTLNEFEKELANTVLKTGELSLVIMPDDVARSILNRLPPGNARELMDYYYLRREKFLDTIQNKKFTEIIKIDDIGNIKKGLAKVAYTGIDELSGIKYTA